MATNPEEIAALIREVTAPAFRDNLLAKGQARSMIWRDGDLPADAPSFARSSLLSYDLLSYAYALMTQGLRLLDQKVEFEAARSAFENAASAIEAVIANGRADNERDFHRLVAGACYHLGRYSARAFSLVSRGLKEANLSHPERALALLMLRSMDDLVGLVAQDRLGGRASDDRLIGILSGAEHYGATSDDPGEDPELDERLFEVVDVALSDHFMGAIGVAMLAFERGERGLIETALVRLRVGLACAGEHNLVPQWWCHRLAIHLLDELWSSSFHERLPLASPSEGLKDWADNRELFIATLMRRRRSEIDLWPSQVDAANRTLDLTANLVVSLPTSAGKTRVAELCILACLSAGRRVVFVTPLRALSAQTEVTLQRTFQPLGKTVSSLYGAIGVSEVDENFLRDSNIIVATPEKLDFALRSDPDLLNDVGLVVLDEGHMIGLTEREVRYEVQIQRLLQRSDAKGRRIVCLSAILPDGKQLEDFTAWLTGDQPDGLIKKDWRPTRLRYGEVTWKGDHARLDISVGAERPFVERFLTPSLPKGRKTRQYPNDLRELCIATAWALVADAHSVLIFCPLRRSVEPFARAIVGLAKRGTLPSILAHDPAVLVNALTIGAEWLGKGSAILECLRLGVAIHHGALPTAFRKEVERLLRDGVLKVTISSPTLAQGLNLSASTLIFHGLMRNGEEIDIAEFRNVVGRAGRAYVDVEGLALLPMFDNITGRKALWERMIASAKGKEMESGLLRLVLTLLQRMIKKHKPKDPESMVDYLAGNAAWDFPTLEGESRELEQLEQGRWSSFLTTLDTAILSMLGEREVADEDIEATLDEVLTSSLWSRRIVSRQENQRKMLNAGLAARARYIWRRTSTKQRRGYFLAGVGLRTGKTLDAHAPVLNQLLATASIAILNGDNDTAIVAITTLAGVAFGIEPFGPTELPANWANILNSWLKGETIASIADGREDEVLQFVEQALVYRLPWAMEAIRVRAVANSETIENGIMIEDLELGLAAAAVETGTLKRPATILMRAGFSSRIAAIRAIDVTGADFTTLGELRRWLRSDEVVSRALDSDWPTAESHSLWLQFVENLTPARPSAWTRQDETLEVQWDDFPAGAGTPVRLHDEDDLTIILSADFTRLGHLKSPINPKRLGLVQATVASNQDYLDITYLGPKDLRDGRPAVGK